MRLRFARRPRPYRRTGRPVLCCATSDEILKDHTDDTVLLTPDAVFRGRDELRGFFDAVLTGLFKPGTYDLTVDVERIEGEIAYITWHANCAGGVVAKATDTFVLRDGKIAVHTHTGRG